MTENDVNRSVAVDNETCYIYLLKTTYYKRFDFRIIIWISSYGLISTYNKFKKYIFIKSDRIKVFFSNNWVMKDNLGIICYHLYS